MSHGARFIGSEIYRRSRYGGKHPLAIPRVSAVIDLCRALGWLPDDIYIDSPVATPEQLARFHEPDYIRAVIEAEAAQDAPAEVRARHNIGVNGNPVFGEIFRRPATACGATLLATELLRPGGVVYSPAGGTHHGQPGRAAGFCYFNDPVLGLLNWLDQGLERVSYIDIDAHHADGVEDALGDDPRVQIISVHEGRRWPFTGQASRPEVHLHNFPVPADFHDDEFALVLEEGILPLVSAFRPQAIMIQGGADALLEDPLSKLALSNNAHRRAVAELKPLAPRLLMLGGGGYNPYSVARCWAGVWAELTENEIPGRLPQAGETVLRGLTYNRSAGRNPPEHWFTTLKDEWRGGEIRPEVRDAVLSACGRP